MLWVFLVLLLVLGIASHAGQVKLLQIIIYKLRCQMGILEENKDVLARVVKEVDEILALVKKLKDSAQPIPGVEDFLQVNKSTLTELADKLNIETPDTEDLPPAEPTEGEPA